LVEQPGGWGPNGLVGSRWDPAIAARLVGGLSRQGVRVLAIRRPGRHSEPARRSWAFADCRPARQGMIWGSYTRPEELLDLDPTMLAERVRDARDARDTGDTDLVYAVCAHGTRDMCCAIEGRPVAAALARERPGRVWECSHLGGDRFAANVLVLPTGQLYGRITDPAALVAATEAGRTLPELLRGQVGLPPAAQAAVVYAERELALPLVGAIEVLEVGGAPPEVQLVRLRVPDGRCTVGVQRVTGSPAILTCRDTGTKVPLSYRPLWLRAD
jgi:hypothetical protein